MSSVALAAPAQLRHTDHFHSKPSSYARSCTTALRRAIHFSQLHCLPDESACPSLWMLGSGGGSAGLAGQLGMGLALARFIAPHTCTPAMFDHNDQVVQRTSFPTVLAPASNCTETDEHARFIVGTAVYRKLMAGRDPYEPLLSPEDVEHRRQHMGIALRAEFDEVLDGMIVGSPAYCRAEILRLCQAFGTSE